MRLAAKTAPMYRSKMQRLLHGQTSPGPLIGDCMLLLCALNAEELLAERDRLRQIMQQKQLGAATEAQKARLPENWRVLKGGRE